MINSTKCPALGPGNVSDSRMMSRVRRLRAVACACISAFLQSEWCRVPFFVCLHSSCRHATYGRCRNVNENCAQTFQAKWWGPRGYNPVYKTKSLPLHISARMKVNEFLPSAEQSVRSCTVHSRLAASAACWSGGSLTTGPSARCTSHSHVCICPVTTSTAPACKP